MTISARACVTASLATLTLVGCAAPMIEVRQEGDVIAVLVDAEKLGDVIESCSNAGRGVHLVIDTADSNRLELFGGPFGDEGSGSVVPGDGLEITAEGFAIHVAFGRDIEVDGAVRFVSPYDDR